jgi:pyruvate/2-oxoglutarate dehydrogenase complex dihydrolipoamide acyltransferase (E2) component
MRFEMKMPDVATNDSPIRIVRWIAVPGQTVRRGEPLVEMETDKATVEVESVRDGVLVQVLIEAGNTASTGDVIAVLETAE